MLSQSGALGLAILDYAHELNIGLSTFVSVGNKADVSGNDLLVVLGATTRAPTSSRSTSRASATRGSSRAWPRRWRGASRSWP